MRHKSLISALSVLSVAIGINSGAYAASTWVTVANENQSFTLRGAQAVRFGADSRWVQRLLEGTKTCKPSTFGKDPAVGVQKSCQALTEMPWVTVANQNQNFTLMSTQTVRFGADSRWVQKSFSTGTHVCDSTSFGKDPAAGVDKTCQLQTTTPTPTPTPTATPVPTPTPVPPPTWVMVADQNKTFSVTSSSQILRFGADSRWVQKSFSTGTHVCDSTSFGKDPAAGVDKTCQLQTTTPTPTPTPVPPPTWVMVADQNKTFSVTSSSQILRFGADSRWVQKSFSTGTHVCDSTSFGKDPAAGVDKTCQLRNHYADADSNSDTRADSDTDTRTHSNTDTRADSNTDTRTHSNTDTRTDSNAGANSQADSDTDTCADSNTNTRTDSNAGANSQADSDTDARADPNTNTHTESNAGTHTGAGPDTCTDTCTDTNAGADSSADTAWHL